MRRVTTVAIVLLMAIIGDGSALAMQPTGKVIGHVYRSGGPPRRNMGPKPIGDITVVLVENDGKKVTHATSREDGGFVLSVRPGSYVILAYIGTHIDGEIKPALCGETKSVLVRPDEPTKTVVYCSIK